MRCLYWLCDIAEALKTISEGADSQTEKVLTQEYGFFFPYVERDGSDIAISLRYQ